MDCCVSSVEVADLWLIGNKDRIGLKTALSLRRSFASGGALGIDGPLKCGLQGEARKDLDAVEGELGFIQISGLSTGVGSSR